MEISTGMLVCAPRQSAVCVAACIAACIAVCCAVVVCCSGAVDITGLLVRAPRHSQKPACYSSVCCSVYYSVHCSVLRCCHVF